MAVPVERGLKGGTGNGEMERVCEESLDRQILWAVSVGA